MSKETIGEIIDRSDMVKRNFKQLSGVGMPTFNTINGSEFEEWLADIKAIINQSKSDSLTQNILKLTDSFDGWSDEENFEKLKAQLKAVYKNYDKYFDNATESIEDTTIKKNRVFVVHGRNEKIRRSMFSFLCSIGVEPIEWDEAKGMTGKTSPYIGEVLNAAFSNAQAIVVLFTPDDEARLINASPDEPEYERNLTPQARPNVIFEAGMAMGRIEKRTILVEFGKLRPFSDISGRNTIRFVDTPEKRMSIVEHLKMAGVEVNIAGKSEWLHVGDFSV